MLRETFNKWHRKMGIISALFVIMLVITGLMLNHIKTLNLANIFVQNNFLLNLYNINPSEKPTAFLIDNHWINGVGERIYFDENEIAEINENIVGVVKINEEIVVAFNNQLLLLNNQGNVIEHFTEAEGVPAGMRAIGTAHGNDLVIRGVHGNYRVDLDNLKWHEEASIDAIWSKDQPLPTDLAADLMRQYRGKGLPFERVVLDIHSGRILGEWGIYLVDMAAILFFLLALSGAWMWFKQS